MIIVQPVINVLIILMVIVLLILFLLYVILTIKGICLRFLLDQEIKKYPVIRKKFKNNIFTFGLFYMIDRSRHSRFFENIFVLFDSSQKIRDEISFNNWYHFKDIKNTKDKKLINILERFRKNNRDWLFIGRLSSFFIIIIFLLFVAFIFLKLMEII